MKKPIYLLNSGLVAAVVVFGFAALAQQRFDSLVREDFFAGIAGDMDKFERAMKFTEDTLAKTPNHPEAKVWHGAGVFFRANTAFEKGDSQKGLALWQVGLDEMKAAVKLAPNDVAVLIPRAAMLTTASRFAPASYAKPILETGVQDYEKVLQLQAVDCSRRSAHSRGELLTALWGRLEPSWRPTEGRRLGIRGCHQKYSKQVFHHKVGRKSLGNVIV